jgi:hypothetical protein
MFPRRYKAVNMPSHQQDPAAVRRKPPAEREFADSGFLSQPQFAGAPGGTPVMILAAYTRYGGNATLFDFLSLSSVRFRTVNQAFSCAVQALQMVKRAPSEMDA